MLFSPSIKTQTVYQDSVEVYQDSVSVDGEKQGTLPKKQSTIQEVFKAILFYCLVGIFLIAIYVGLLIIAVITTNRF
jgi:hypothetical protein